MFEKLRAKFSEAKNSEPSESTSQSNWSEDLAPPLGANIEEVSLCSLKPGDSATVVRFKIDEENSKVLQAMGLAIGSTLEVVKPGDPCIVRIGQTRIGLGQSYSSRVFVKVEPQGSERA